MQILGWRNNVCFGSSTSTSNSSFFYNYTYEYKWESSLSCAGSASSFDVHYGICVSISEEGVYSYSEIIQYYNDKEIVNTDDDTISVTHYSKGTYILSIGAIIGIVIGSIAFFGLSAFCYFSRNNSRNNFIKRKWEVFHQNLRQNFPLNPFFEKFLKDYWLEMKIYDPIIALLSDWYIFEPPSNQSDFQRRPIIRVYYVIVSIILTAGIASLFNCTFFNKPSQELALFLTLLVVTIPSEIYNFIWFKWVVDHDTLLTKLETKEKTEKMYWYCRQSTGSIAGIFCGLLLGGFSLYIYIITSTYHFTCSEYHRRNIMIDAIMLKLFINPLFMSLPYWRKQGFILLFLGQAGPIIGLLLHYRQYGCKPISTSNINRNHSNLKMVESPFHKDNQSSGSVTKEVEVVTFPNGIIGQEKMNSTTLSMDCIRKLPAFLDETLRLKGLIHYVSPISSKEKIIFEVYENEKFHPVYKNWGQAYGVYLDPSTDHPAYTYVNIILIDRREHR